MNIFPLVNDDNNSKKSVGCEFNNRLVQGMLFDFVAELTVSNQPITVSSNNEVGPILQAIERFLEKRGIDQTVEPIQNWSIHCTSL